MAHFYLGLIAVSVAVLAVHGEREVKITVGVSEVPLGEEFSIKCTVRGLGGAEFLRVVKYFHDDPEPIMFSTYASLQENFKDNARFTMSHTQHEDETVDFLLAVTDARPEDSGMYSCAVYGGDGIVLEDKAPVTILNSKDFSLTVTVIRTSTGEEQIYSPDKEETHQFLLEDSEDFTIEVETSGTNPAPVFSAMVGSRDITPQFTVATDTEIFTGDAGLKGAIFKLYASANVHVDHSFARGFSIVATAPGNLQLEEQLNFAFTGYPPTMETACTNVILAGDHEKDVAFNCSFLSSELPEVYIYYNRVLASGNTEKVSLLPGEYNSHYEVELLEEGAENYAALMKMEIVYPQMFRSYFLVVSTEKGNFTHEFVIERDLSKEIDSSGSSHIISIATVLTCFVMAIFQRSQFF